MTENKPRKTLRIVVAESDITREQLEEIERTEKQTQERPKSLALKDIHVAPMVFQWRLENDNLLNDREHIKDLARALRNQKEPLEAILVTPIGGKFYVIDGHHRLAAYLSTQWTRRVLVRIFEGDLEAAWTEALERNSKSKLPITTETRNEAAWKLNKVKTPKGTYTYSKAKIVKLTGVSDGQVGNQRRVLEALGDEADGLTWKQALGRHKADTNEPFDPENWKEAEARELANKIVASTGINLTRNPDILARALDMIGPGLAEALVTHWLDVAVDVVEAYREEQEFRQKRIEAGEELDI